MENIDNLFKLIKKEASKNIGKFPKPSDILYIKANSLNVSTFQVNLPNEKGAKQQFPFEVLHVNK